MGEGNNEKRLKFQIFPMLIRRWAEDRKYKIVLDTCSAAEQLLFECEDRPPSDLYILDIQMGRAPPR